MGPESGRREHTEVSGGSALPALASPGGCGGVGALRSWDRFRRARTGQESRLPGVVMGASRSLLQKEIGGNRVLGNCKKSPNAPQVCGQQCLCFPGP